MLSDLAFQRKHTPNPNSFTRHRVFGFEDIVLMLINRVVKSIGLEVVRFFSSLGEPKAGTRQAFSAARLKLGHTAFVELNSQHVDRFYKSGLVEVYGGKYLLLAVDGSLFQLPDSQELKEWFGTWKNNHGEGMMAMARASVVYDVLNHQVLSARLSPLANGEGKLFKGQHDGLLVDRPYIYLLDRCYPSFDLCSHIRAGGGHFVARCKKDFNKGVSAFVRSGQAEARIVLSPPTYYAKNKGGKISSAYKEPLEVRIVRIKLKTGGYEYLLTDLRLAKKELAHLYGLRWGVETMYGYLKDCMEIENFSSKKKEGVLQDFHATILAANLIRIVIDEADRELEQKEGSLYKYQVNRKAATALLREDVLKILANPPKDYGAEIQALKQKISRHRTAVKPGRSFERKKYRRWRQKFSINKKRAL